jgi:branched-chain amino acid transport system permease protein
VTRRRAIAAAAVAIALVIAAPFAVSAYWVGLLAQGMIFALLAASLDVLVGYSGLPSMGHAAFYGIAGYGVGLAIVEWGMSPMTAAGIGVLAAVVASVLLAPLALRGRGIFFLVITLAIAQVLWGVAMKWDDLTGGFDGLTGIVRPVVLGFDTADSVTFYYVVAVVVGVSLAALWRFVRSPVGLALQGARDCEARMSQLGYRPWWYRFVAFCVAGSFAGVAGTLDAFYNEYVSPEVLFFLVSATALLMVILGSAGTLWGPAAAGLGLTVLENVVSDYTDRWTLVIGLLYVVTVLLAPRGLLRLRLGRPLHRRTSRARRHELERPEVTA